MGEKGRKIFLLTSSIAIGAILLFINERYIKENDVVLYNLIVTIAVSLIVTAIFSVISDIITPNNINKIAAENFSVLNFCHEYGLCGIYEYFPLTIEEYRQDFINSNEIHIIMNDAKAFLSSNTLLLEERVREKKHKSTFVLQDYNTLDIMSVLTRKNGHIEDNDYYITKIKNVIQYHLVPLNQKCNKSSEFSAYLNPNYNTLAVILTDNYAMVSIYRIAPGKTRVPHYVFRRGGKEYEDVSKDVQKIIKNSERIIM